MIARTEGIVVRITPFSQTSHVVTWITPVGGRLVTVVKGAIRPKSEFLGRYDLFQTCEVLYYKRDRNGLHICRACSPLNQRPELRDHWQSAVCASYVADAASRVSLGGPHHEDLYRLVECVLDTLCRSGASLPLLFWFDLQLAGAMGIAPQLHACPVCGRKESSPRGRVFACSRGGLLCGRCASTRERDDAPVTPAVTAMLRAWQGDPAPRAALNTRCTLAQSNELQRLLARFLQYHLDIELRSRNIAFDVLTLDIRENYYGEIP